MTLTPKKNTPFISHQAQATFSLPAFEETLRQCQDLVLPLTQSLELLYQLASFELGRFLLMHKGLNGYWTAYIILTESENLSPLEKWLLYQAPTIKATRERFKIFQQELQGCLRNNIRIASVPCGLMDDLLRLDYKNFHSITLTGIDLDHDSLQLAQENAHRHSIDFASFLQRDAWSLEEKECYDVLTSNGLNIYQPNDEKLLALYDQFYQCLKPGGLLITSFLTPPFTPAGQAIWQNYDEEDLIKQKALFKDIIQVNWQAYKTENETCSLLKKVGFTITKIRYDSQGMFPTLIAQKL